MKQKRIARWLSLLLALALCLSLGTAALADTTEEDGSGTGTTALSEEAQALQDMIDALPAAEEITADNAADVEAQLDAIDAAKLELYEAGNTEIDYLDYDKYEAAGAALAALETTAQDEDDTGAGTEAGTPEVIDDEGTTYVASVTTGDEPAYYTTLQAAIDAAGSGDTVTLLSDVSLSTFLSISSGTNVTLDLNNHSITRDSSSGNTAIYVDGGTLTIKNGSVSASVYPLYVLNQGNVTVDNCAITATTEYTTNASVHAVNINSGSTVTITNSTIKGGDSGIAVFGDSSNTTSLTVTDSTITGYYYGIATNGSTGNGAVNVTVNGGSISATNGWGMYLPAINSTTTINNNATITGLTGIEIRAGRLVVNNGTIKGTGSFSSNANGSGTTTSGVGIAVIQHTTKQAIDVDILDGTISGVYGVYENDTQNTGATSSISIDISGGNFSGTTNSVSVSSTKEDSSTSVASISGGTYSSDVSAYVDTTTLEVTEESNGTYTISTLTADNATASLTVDGETTYYSTLQAAIDAAGETAATVTLLADTTENITIAECQTITLNLNGHNITGAEGVKQDVIYVTNGGTLTVTGSGTVTSVVGSYAAVFNNGTTTLNGGTYTSSGTSTWYTIVNHGDMIINDGVIVTNTTNTDSSLIENGYSSYTSGKERSGYVAGTNSANPTLTINGGTFSTNGLNVVKNDDGGVLTINDGTFTSTRTTSNGTSKSSGAVIMNWNEATISGGEFNGSNNTCVLLNGYCDASVDKGLLTINGGNYTAYNNGSLFSTGGGATSGGILTIADGTFTGTLGNSVVYEVAISGGSYSQKVPDSWCAANYVPVTTQDANGMYTVAPKTLNDDFTITVAGADSIVYDGTAQTPDVTVTYNGAELVADTDYTVEYSNNTNAGTATVTVKGTGDYSGEIETTFTINAATPVISYTMTASKNYDGEAVEDPVVTVTLANGEDYTGTPTVTYYDVSDPDNPVKLDSAPSAVGSYKVVIEVSDADSNYATGTAEATFTIDENSQTVKITTANATYDGKAHEVTVEAGEGSTVTVTYTDESGNTVQTPVEAGTYTAAVTVTRTGYKTVSETVTVTISKAAQSISYAAASVSKTEGDAAFTNALTATSLFGSVTYSSSNTAVATVDANGQVTIVGPGTATITATAAGSDSYTAASASYTLTVAAKEAGETEPTASPDSGTTTVTITPAPTATATSPSTGDESSVLLWAVLLVCAACGLGATAVVSGKKQKNQ